jgi:hypothetical protein
VLKTTSPETATDAPKDVASMVVPSAKYKKDFSPYLLENNQRKEEKKRIHE